MLSRSGILYARGSIEFRLIQHRQQADEMYRLRTEKTGHTLQSLTVRLLAAQLGEKIDTQTLNSSIDRLVSEYEKGLMEFLGISENSSKENPERQAQAERTKKFLKEATAEGQSFGSLDDIMKKFVNS